MSGRYYLHTKKCDFTGIGKVLHVDPVVVRLMCNREIPPEKMDAFLYPDLSDLNDPFLLPDAEKGAAILAGCIREGAAVRIIGDYDVDGVCSTYILLRGLKRLGADVDYRIPERERHGYGLNAELIDLALADGRQVILTCDNGISEVQSIARAKQYGMTVIVTDHHEPPQVLPQADALIDPKCGDAYPFREICGAVVAMKFLQVLYEMLGEDPDAPLDYLEFAALATVCDVMPLTDENRLIVREGLIRMEDTSNLGLRALISVNALSELKAWHCGFVLGPCLNAAGRLRTAEEAMKLFLASSPDEAHKQAAYLKELNESRKTLTENGITEALEQIERTGCGEDRVLVVHLPDCPDSIAGIIAGKIRERLFRPVFIVTGRGDVLKGSARSIPAYSLYAEITKVSDVFVKFGGHPLAAGFSVRAADLPVMRTRLNEMCTLTPEDLLEKKYIDIQMPMYYVSLPLLDQISLLEPYGTGNPAPVFAEKKVRLCHAVRIGKQKQYLRLRLQGERNFTADAVYFGDCAGFFEKLKARFGPDAEENLLRARFNAEVSVVYQVSVNVYRGERSIRFQIRDFIF